MASGALSRFTISRSGSWLDHVLSAFAIYAVPTLLALGTVAAQLFLPPTFPTRTPPELLFRAVVDRTETMNPAQARAELASGALLSTFSTNLSTSPIWFSATAPATGSIGHSNIELPSRHAQMVECWQAATLRWLGKADRDTVSGQMRATKAGFSVALDSSSEPAPILCRARFSGPAHLTVLAWDSRQLHDSELDFQDNASLIAGGLLTLAVFVFVTALINREWTYVIFSVWLVGNLRLSANAMGWDTEWLDRVIPAADQDLIRKLTFAAYYLVTGALFSRLFRRQLEQIGYHGLLRAGQFAGLAMLILAGPLPYSLFIPVLWGLGGFGIGVLIFLLARLALKERSSTVMWYAGALGIVLFSTLAEVIGAAFDIPMLAASVSPVLVALSSSMMAAFAIAVQLRHDRERRHRAELELRNTYEVTPTGLFTLDASGRFVRTNPSLRAMLNIQSADDRSLLWKDCFQEGAWGALHALLQTGSDGEIEIGGAPARGSTGKRFLLKVISSGGFIEGSLQDVTKRSKAVAKLRFLADHDFLTGCLNRRGIEEAIARHHDSSTSRALAYLDLNRFKLVNDLFGHRCGDEILKQVASRIRMQLDERSYFGRIGGDEFVCLMRDMSIDEAAAQCQTVLAALNTAPYQVDSRVFQVNAAIGLVEFLHDMRGQDALSHADRACQEAKNNPHNPLVVHRRGAGPFEQLAAKLRLAESFGGNDLPPGLFLMMQPIMSLAAPAGSLNFEVLLRMRAPDGTIVSPDKIIAAAEETGKVASLDKWVLRTTLEWLTSHQASLPNTKFVCVNVDGGSLNDERFTQEIFALFARFRPVLPYLCIEITESVALHDLANTQRFIARVHEMGSTVALDDFGAGYTSFRYLKCLSADALKIDGEFVRSMRTHPADAAIVVALVRLARDLGMRSVAEWVEDIETLKALKEIGVDYVQGYIISKPQESAEILTVDSSASFVADPNVIHYLEMLSETRDVAVRQHAPGC
jgi:diguanylate cyclase (GGDEF)-like protein